tara:strand:- start:177 stop:446 length:270 start_codon:yes stop_codon:yes gene_type:complete
MWNFKSVSLFVASLIVVILVSMKMANAEENKTITPQEFVSNVAEVPGKVGNWFTGEVEKTKEYQTKVWSEAKTKWPWTMFKSKNNASQD